VVGANDKQCQTKNRRYEFSCKSPSKGFSYLPRTNHERSGFDRIQHEIPRRGLSRFDSRRNRNGTEVVALDEIDMVARPQALPTS
jgi:hypothetical protein